MKTFKKKFTKTVNILLSAVLIFSVFTALPFSAYADEDKSSQDIGDDKLMTNTTLLSGGTYTSAYDLTIDNRINCSGDVKLKLTEGVTLTVKKGFHVTGDSSLTIDGKGTLVIDNVDENNAGIGGNNNENLSKLTINSGTVSVIGGLNAAAIGGGKNGFVGSVTINGGTVTAKGEAGGAGIGCGALDDIVTALPGDSDGIYIKGGTVNATGGNSAAGIGEGSLIDVMREGDAEMVISISGGTVKAYSNNLSDEAIQPEQSPKRNKQDIGGASCNISITGGNVWAKGGGISSEKQVTFGWTSVNDSIYTYELNAEGDLSLAKDFRCKETKDLYSKGIYYYNNTPDVNQLIRKTLIPPFEHSGQKIPYIDENWKTQYADDPILVSTNFDDFGGGWYALTESAEFTNRITCSGDVYLILCDGKTFSALSGITVNEGSSLTIYGQELKSGALIANAEKVNGSAGIGGEENKNSGTINIVGGKITAKGGQYGAGIGGGSNGSGTVSVDGGTVTATGGQYGAGIGGGYNAAGYVTLNAGNDGTVIATGGQYGAGIGGSASDNENSNTPVSTVEINGTTISATGGENGAGIGSGQYGSARITLNTGVIEKAVGGENAAAIGSGLNGTAECTLTNGVIKESTGGSNAAAIGSGRNGICTVEIKACRIEAATGGTNGAGIGSGDRGLCNISIEGGTIYNAKGGTNGAGIGGGFESGKTEIKISDGNITSTGGKYGAGIGGGNSSQIITVTISGGHTEAHGAVNSAAIGSNNTPAEVNIQGGYVYAYGGTDEYHSTKRLPGIGSGSGKSSIINLSWTNDDDSINSNSYGGNVTLLKAFKNKNNTSEIFRRGNYGSDTVSLNGKTLVPHDIPTHTVTWKNDDGTVLKTDTVEEGLVPSYGEDNPTKDGGELYKYEFRGWTPEVTAVAGDAVYTAAYGKKSKIVIDDGITNGTVSSDKEFAAQGETVTLTVTPEDGYRLKYINIEKYDNTSVTYKVEDEAKTFTMPDNPVKVKAEFEPDDLGAKLAGYSLSLDGDIGVNFYMDLDSEIANSSTAYMHFTIPKNGDPGEQIVYVNKQADETLPYALQKTVKGKTYYVFKCNVAAKEVTSQIKAQLIEPENGKKGKEYTYSVKDYAKYLLEHQDEDPKFKNAVPLVKTLLNYSSYAQVFFDKNSDNLASDGLLTDEEKNVSHVTAETVGDRAYTENITVEGLSFESSSLSLKSETTLSLLFISDKPVNFECETNTVETEQNGSYWVARIRNIPSGKAQEDYTVTIKIDDQNAGTVTYNPMRYCYNVLNGGTNDQNLINVVRAFYLYTQAAKDYFKA